jgi:hypothetical protein
MKPDDATFTGKSEIRPPHITPSITSLKEIVDAKNSLDTILSIWQDNDSSKSVANGYQPPDAGTVTSCVTLGINDPSRNELAVLQCSSMLPCHAELEHTQGFGLVNLSLA